jgi:(p)ppGpp synthase/HD superfamily hydrolase
LQNGDVVSILTGDKGKPATDWMRYAKSRSTRSKLRSYFRQKQKESLGEAGKILLMDFVCMHGPLIEKSSYMPTELKVPTTIEGVAEFLPGRTRFVDIDDLLINIGKKHDRMFLHMMVSKLFLVPLSVLVDAEKNKKALVPSSVVTAVYESRKVAKDAAQAVASSHTAEPRIPLFNKANDTATAVKEAIDESFADNTEDLEYADPEHLCDDCLPVLGDDIIGTKPADGDDVLTTVHRIGCPHAQHAMNHASAGRVTTPSNVNGRINSVSLRMMKESGLGATSARSAEIPVKLQWSGFNPYEDDTTVTFLSEVVVVAQDRKLLLADCSEIVSEMSKIVKTGSATTHEHATLVFLVQVANLENLQKLMDELGQVRSVMSVERRVRLRVLLCACTVSKDTPDSRSLSVSSPKLSLVALYCN